MDFFCSKSIDHVSETMFLKQPPYVVLIGGEMIMISFVIPPPPSYLVVVGAVSLSLIVFNPFNYIQFNKYFIRF